jgi:leucyl aminopeptidase
LKNLLKVEKLGYWSQTLSEAESLIRIVNAIEVGRIVYRDIGGSDPERMAAPRVHNYVQDNFENTEIKVNKSLLGFTEVEKF